MQQIQIPHKEDISHIKCIYLLHLLQIYKMTREERMLIKLNKLQAIITEPLDVI